MEESWAEIWLVLDLNFYPGKGRNKVMLGEHIFWSLFTSCRKSWRCQMFKDFDYFFWRKKTCGELGTPVVFLVPSLPCSRKTSLENCCVVDSTWLIWALKRNQSPRLSEARPSCLRKTRDVIPWYHPRTMRISRLRFYALKKGSPCVQPVECQVAQTSSDSFLQTLGSLTLSRGRIRYCRWKPLRIYGSERAAPEIVSSA